MCGLVLWGFFLFCVLFLECLFLGLLLICLQLLEKLQGSHSLYGSCLGMPGDQGDPWFNLSKNACGVKMPKQKIVFVLDSTRKAPFRGLIYCFIYFLSVWWIRRWGGSPERKEARWAIRRNPRRAQKTKVFCCSLASLYWLHLPLLPKGLRSGGGWELQKIGDNLFSPFNIHKHRRNLFYFPQHLQRAREREVES